MIGILDNYEVGIKELAFSQAERAAHAGVFVGKLKTAFTLAEVLITLGIIGIVAAMTMPAMMTKFQKQTTVTKLKKLYSSINDAYLLSVNENGESKNWLFPQNSDIKNDEFFDKYFLPYMKARKRKTTLRYEVSNYQGLKSNIALAALATYDWDGSCLWIRSNGQFLMFTVDINCKQGPNIIGRDVFDLGEMWWSNREHKLVPWRLNLLANNTYSRESIINACKTTNFRNGFPVDCLVLIVYDGWEIKDDYPW